MKCFPRFGENKKGADKQLEEILKKSLLALPSPEPEKAA
jgi:hypothetical protein